MLVVIYNVPQMIYNIEIQIFFNNIAICITYYNECKTLLQAISM